MVVRRNTAVFLLLLVLFLLTAVIAFVSNLRREQSQKILHELKSVKAGTVADEKTKQEIIKLRIENEEKAIFLNTFIANFSIGASVVVAISAITLTSTFLGRPAEDAGPLIPTRSYSAVGKDGNHAGRRGSTKGCERR